MVVEPYPSEKYEYVNWDDDITNIWKNKIHVPNHQPVIMFFALGIAKPFREQMNLRESCHAGNPTSFRLTLQNYSTPKDAVPSDHDFKF